MALIPSNRLPKIPDLQKPEARRRIQTEKVSVAVQVPENTFCADVGGRHVQIRLEHDGYISLFVENRNRFPDEKMRAATCDFDTFFALFDELVPAAASRFKEKLDAQDRCTR